MKDTLNLELPQPDIDPPKNYKWGYFSHAGKVRPGNLYFENKWKMWEGNVPSHYSYPRISPVRTHRDNGIPVEILNFIPILDDCEFVYMSNVKVVRDNKHFVYVMPDKDSTKYGWCLVDENTNTDTVYQHVIKVSSSSVDTGEDVFQDLMDTIECTDTLYNEIFSLIENALNTNSISRREVSEILSSVTYDTLYLSQ